MIDCDIFETVYLQKTKDTRKIIKIMGLNLKVIQYVFSAKRWNIRLNWSLLSVCDTFSSMYRQCRTFALKKRSFSWQVSRREGMSINTTLDSIRSVEMTSVFDYESLKIFAVINVRSIHMLHPNSIFFEFIVSQNV